MPTRTATSRANRSADARLVAHDRRRAEARESDHAYEDATDKRQWAVVVGWLLAESKHVDREDRRRMLDYLITCARQMNEASRQQ